MDRSNSTLPAFFEQQIYGRQPSGLRIAAAQWTPTPPATWQTVLRISSTASASRDIPITLHLPPGSPPHPTILFLCNREKSEIEIGPTNHPGIWPVRLITAAGFATAAVHIRDVCHDDGIDPGILDLDTGPLDQSRPGAVSAWSWAASRAADSLLTHPAVDPRRLAIAGHSRCGKAALLAAARDPRFAAVFSNQSGAAGAAHSASKSGERIADLARVFPTWFAPALASWAHRESELPIDQDRLLASIAPRLLFINSAAEDAWCDPEAELHSCRLASPAWAALGQPGLNLTSPSAPPSTGHLDYTSGCLAYRRRPGHHDLLQEDWSAFLAFLSPRWSRC